MKYEKVTVFCAASQNCENIYLNEAQKLGEFLAKTNRTIFYGGGKVGLMGALADAAIKFNGKVIGVIPKFFHDIELGHNKIQKMIIVNTLHQREEKLLTYPNCIIALPGGIGTFSELLQAIVWKRLNQINADIFIININNYFDPLLKQLKNALDKNFLRQEFKNIWNICKNTDELIMIFEKELSIQTINKNLT